MARGQKLVRRNMMWQRVICNHWLLCQTTTNWCDFT